MKTIHVAAAIICDDMAHPAKVFATARGYGEQKGFWEFPGGKLEPGESEKVALVREIKEELDVTICVGAPVETIEYDYPKFHLSMACFLCQVTDGKITLKEAEDGRWLSADTLNTVPWLPADEMILDKLRILLS